MAGARAKGYPQRVVRSSHALPLASALAIVAGGCGDSLDVSVDYRVVGLAPVTGGTCGAVPRTPPLATGATKVRFTFRDHTATGPGPLRCDVVLPRGGDAPVLAVPRKAEPVDLWVEYFTDAGALVARGQATDVDLTGGTGTIYTTDADGYACEPAQPTQPRAFHAATLLPTGEVLFLAGHRIDHEQRLDRLDARVQLADLLHHRRVDGEPAGGVDDQHVGELDARGPAAVAVGRRRRTRVGLVRLCPGLVCRGGARCGAPPRRRPHDVGATIFASRASTQDIPALAQGHSGPNAGL